MIEVERAQRVVKKSGWFVSPNRSREFPPSVDVVPDQSILLACIQHVIQNEGELIYPSLAASRRKSTAKRDCDLR